MKIKVNLFLILVSILFFSCSSDDDRVVTPVKDPDVYVLTSINDYYGGFYKNNQLTELGEQDLVNNFFVTNDKDVYMSGGTFINRYKRIPKYWKNGNETTLNVFDAFNSNESNGHAYSIYVDKNEIYVTGIINSNIFFRDKQKIVYWKNGELTSLTDGTYDVDVQDIFVHKNDLYVFGSEKNASGKYVLKYWKNNMPTSLTDGTQNARVTSVKTYGNDIYVLGFEGDETKYWKNGVPVILAQGYDVNEYVSAICINENGVFFTGKKDGKLAYWNSDDFIELEGASTDKMFTTGIVSFKNDIYVSGYNNKSGSKAVYWKNGKLTELPSTHTFTYGKDIIVK